MFKDEGPFGEVLREVKEIKEELQIEPEINDFSEMYDEVERLRQMVGGLTGVTESAIRACEDLYGRVEDLYFGDDILSSIRKLEQRFEHLMDVLNVPPPERP